LERELRRREPGVKTLYVDLRFASAMAGEVQDAARSAGKILVAVYIVPTAGRAMQTPATILRSILDIARQKTVVVAFGSPYIAADFPEIENYLCAYSNVPTSESAVVQALYGQMAIQGHLPVTIPGFAPRGTGIQKSPKLP
jgi:beta-N-acetylhexosaminidase